MRLDRHAQTEGGKGRGREGWRDRGRDTHTQPYNTHVRLVDIGNEVCETFGQSQYGDTWESGEREGRAGESKGGEGVQRGGMGSNEALFVVVLIDS